MKLNKNIMALATAAAFGLSGQAFAAGTAAGTTIDNSVSLTFTVDGENQTEGANATFVVDNKVDLTVSWDQTALVSAVPDKDDAVLKFTITNEGNNTQDFLLSLGESVDGTTLPYDDSDGNDTDNQNSEGTYAFYLDDGDDAEEIGADDVLITSIEDLTADSSAVIWVTADIPAAAVDFDKIGLLLTVSAADATGTILSETTGDKNSDLNGTPMIVFAEAESTVAAADEYDGQFTALAGIDVVTANLETSKTVVVKSDPINNTTNPRAIPGAIVTYTIEVENVGRVAADSVRILDVINDIDGLLDGSKGTISVTHTGAGLVTDASDGTKVDYTLSTIVATDGTADSGPDYISIAFDVEVD